jgi:hypothetical protein
VGRGRAGWVAGYRDRCASGKLSFDSRKDAKRYAQQRGLADLRPYRCLNDGCPYWHLGHLPTIVVAGVLDRHDLFPVDRSGRSAMPETETDA